VILLAMILIVVTRPCTSSLHNFPLHDNRSHRDDDDAYDDADGQDGNGVLNELLEFTFLRRGTCVLQPLGGALLHFLGAWALRPLHRIHCHHRHSRFYLLQ